MTSTGEFAMPGMEVGRKRYIAFMNELEAAKAVGDADRLQMRASKDDVAGGASGTTQRVANPNPRDLDHDRRDAPADPRAESPVKSKSEALQVAAATPSQPEAARVLPSSLAPSAAASLPLAVQVQVRSATGTTMRLGPGASAGGPASTVTESKTRTGGDYTMTLAGSGIGSVSSLGQGLGGPAGSVPSVPYGVGGKPGRVAPAPAST